MNCPHCKAKLPEGANFCFGCGFDMVKRDMVKKKAKKPAKMNQQEVDFKVEYGGYLSVGGWINIIAGVILAIILFDKSRSSYSEGGMVWLGIISILSGVLVAWLYFGIHRVILKLNRIERALGIDNVETVIKDQPNPGEEAQESSI